MVDRERGFIIIQRRIQSSPIWRSLSGEQRSVFLSILLLANWSEDRFMYGTEWVEVGRGELAHALETIADHAAVSIKVVRTTIKKLLSGHVVSERTGTASGRGPRVLTVLNYNRYQDRPDEEGTPTGTPGAQDRAQTGHATGTPGAPREQDQQDQQEKLALRPSTSPPPPAPSAVVLTLPCVGTGPSEFAVTDAQLDKWRGAFPGLDVLAEVRKAGAWLDASPSKRKTHAGVPRFLVNWFTREQNNPRRTHSGPVASTHHPVALRPARGPEEAPR